MRVFRFLNLHGREFVSFVMYWIATVDCYGSFPFPGSTFMSLVMNRIAIVDFNVSFPFPESTWTSIYESCNVLNLQLWSVMWVFRFLGLHEGVFMSLVMYWIAIVGFNFSFPFPWSTWTSICESCNALNRNCGL